MDLWIEADQLGKEGWSPIEQPSYKVMYCKKLMNQINVFKK